MSNQSRMTEFLLHGFTDTQEMKTFHFITFLTIYLMALIENLLIITLIIYSHHLHKPMYFFLANLAIQDLGSISVPVPKSMANSLMNTNTISYNGCICQVFFLVLFGASNFLNLVSMAYDRYVAICNPLHHETVMNKKACIQMALSSWLAGLFLSILYTANTFTKAFCSNSINQFFCEVPELFKVACSHSNLMTFWFLYIGDFIGSVSLVFIVYSYVQIFRAVLRIPSAQGKHKAFSTCLPHIIAVSLYFLSGSLAYLKPKSKSFSTLDLVISMFYCMLTPTMNPLIYSIRNKELKMAFWKLTANIFPQFNYHLPVQ